MSFNEGRYTFWGRYVPDGEQPRQRLVSFDVGRELRFVWTPDGAEFETLITVEPDERGFAAVQVWCGYRSTWMVGRLPGTR